MCLSRQVANPHVKSVFFAFNLYTTGCLSSDVTDGGLRWSPTWLTAAWVPSLATHHLGSLLVWGQWGVLPPSKEGAQQAEWALPGTITAQPKLPWRDRPLCQVGAFPRLAEVVALGMTLFLTEPTA